MVFEGKRYSDYSSYIKLLFGERIQKISIDVGFTCPNRDGSKGYGGCTYCNNNTFNPAYCGPQKSIKDQLEEGISFFKRKGKTAKFLAYFQAYTNTYDSLVVLKSFYEEALRVPGIIGLVIGTRPDCVEDELLDYLTFLAKKYYIALELGVESTNNDTLEIVNRCHTYEDVVDTFERCKNRGIDLGAHLILGLPGETMENYITHAKNISKLPIQTLKIHHLQIVKGSVMHVHYKRAPENFNLFSIENYIKTVIEFISYIRPEIIIERFISESPQEFLVAPIWGLKNFEMVAKIDKALVENSLWQGKNFAKSNGIF